MYGCTVTDRQGTWAVTGAGYRSGNKEQESWQRDNLYRKENKMGRPGRGKDNKSCYVYRSAFVIEMI